MALFGRASLPHRSSLSRFLAEVDRPCLQAFRTLFEQYSFAEGWTAETSGASGIARGVATSSLMWMRRLRPHDNGRCPVIPHCLLLDTDSMRSVRPVTAGASVGRWCAHAPRRFRCTRANGIVARHPAPAPGQDIPVGKRVGEWVYELFLTTLAVWISAMSATRSPHLPVRSSARWAM
jgi:hypothetical protein